MKHSLDEIEIDVEGLVALFLNSHRIFVYGAGRSGLVAKAFAIRLAHLGFQTFVIGESICAPVQQKDLVIIVSGSGETIPSVMTAEIAERIGAKLLVVTGKKNGPLNNLADMAILFPQINDDKKRECAPLGTVFEATAWIFLDSIIAVLMKETGENESTMSARHSTL